EISPVCPTEASSCRGGRQPGIQKYVYKGTFTFPQQCTDWFVSWRDCNRNASITNIVDPDKNCLYIEVMINNEVAPCNNSPRFNNEPVAFICAGQSNFINPGTVEDEGDRLVFKTVVPKTGRFTNVQYRNPFSATNPMTSSPAFSINSNSGDIAVAPQNVEVSVTAILVEEYRNGVLIGSVMRDIQLIARDCNNQNPVISGISNTHMDSIVVCAGSLVDFHINGRDPDVGQALTMTWNKGIDTTRATFEVSPSVTRPRGIFRFQTLPDEDASYMFTVTVTDDFCPIMGSATRAFRVIVKPRPVVTTESPYIVACTDQATIVPLVLGNGPFTYRWNTGETTPSITKGNGNYTLTVIDANKCETKYTAVVDNGLRANFGSDKICAPGTVSFIDSSTSSVTNITNWSWNFGDPSSGSNNTSAQQNPGHHYSTHGNYNVILNIRDDQNCSVTARKRIKVCDRPVADFDILSYCQNSFMIRDASSIQLCGISRIRIDYGDGTVANRSYVLVGNYFPGDPKYDDFIHSYENPGTYTVSYTIFNEYGCESTAQETVTIHPFPTVNIAQSSFFFRCNSPNSVLDASWSGGLPPLTATWSNIDLLPNTPSRPVSEPGTYSISVVDSRGCGSSSTRYVYYPVIADFRWDHFCEPEDAVTFNDNSISHWGVATREWTFGDGQNITTTAAEVDHNYASEGKYPVHLLVTDNSACTDTITIPLRFELPKHFKMEPTTICLGQELVLESPRSYLMDSLYWSFGNDDSIIVRHRNSMHWRPLEAPGPHFSINNTEDYYYNTTYTYEEGAGETFPVSLTIVYNNEQCTRTYEEEITIHPKFDVSYDGMEGYCAGAPTRFYANQDNILGPGNEVESWNWTFLYDDYLHHHHNPAEGHHEDHHHFIEVASSNEQNPEITFERGGNYLAYLSVRNGDGCETVFTSGAFGVVELFEPEVCEDEPCVNRQTKFFYVCNDNIPEVVLDHFEWSFGDGSDPVTVQEPFHIYQEAGWYQVDVSIGNTMYGCYESATKLIPIYPLPVPDFDAYNACLGTAMEFKDRSAASTDSSIIVNYHWSFGDGNISEEKDPLHLYEETGEYTITYYVRSSTGTENQYCTDTIRRNVIVHPNPEAGFSANMNEVIALRPIRFYDESAHGVEWQWYFGNEDSLRILDPTNTSPEYIFRQFAKDIDVTQIVYNEFGCTDTASMVLDLNIYMLVPNAFSPNGDANNDGFNIVYKGLKELVEFKIYNRWGQLIFDGGQDLNASWDGTHQGADQPIGVYLYYIKALNLLDEEMISSGKVTLIR
ncbi:MAG: PKD domain-containing protein, partial [Cytophagaceae bacterium]